MFSGLLTWNSRGSGYLASVFLKSGLIKKRLRGLSRYCRSPPGRARASIVSVCFFRIWHALQVSNCRNGVMLQECWCSLTVWWMIRGGVAYCPLSSDRDSRARGTFRHFRDGHGAFPVKRMNMIPFTATFYPFTGRRCFWVAVLRPHFNASPHLPSMDISHKYGTSSRYIHSSVHSNRITARLYQSQGGGIGNEGSYLLLLSRLLWCERARPTALNAPSIS